MGKMKIRPLLFGMATYIPGVYYLKYRVIPRKTGGARSARFCYSAWLRHLIIAHENKLIQGVPTVVAELGPGDSLGIGLAALVSGVMTYVALDIVRFANVTRNLEIFDELVALFQSREEIPGEEEFPQFKTHLESYAFPSEILSDDRLGECLQGERLERIRDSLLTLDREESASSCISYIVPWCGRDMPVEPSVDMVFSQDVLEHVDDLGFTYQTLTRWLKPGGVMSHQIDFKSHGKTTKWNGHWGYSRFVWRLLRGKRPYFLNRQPHSAHIGLLAGNNLDIRCDRTIQDEAGIVREELAPEFKHLSDEDLITSGALIQALKPR
jgi:SAM-dependent methyltransferase